MGVRAQGEGEGRGGKGVRRRGDHRRGDRPEIGRVRGANRVCVRAQTRAADARHPSTMHATGSDAAPDATIHATTDDSAAGSEVALLRVTTHAMEQLAAALTAKPTRLDADERAKFAAAMKRCGDAVMRCR